MFNQSSGAPAAQALPRRPISNMQPPHGAAIAPQMPPANSDSHAQEKLVGYIYEYLMLNGAPKTAESFKEEVISNFPNAQFEAAKNGHSFLKGWWGLFYDLYSAAPDRRDMEPHTMEAKAFHDLGFVASNPPYVPPGHPIMNGIHAPGMPGGPGMGMPGEGMMAGGFNRFPGRPGGAPGGMPPQVFPMFPGSADPRAAMPGQRMPPNAMRMAPAGAFPPQSMRAGAPGAPNVRYGAPPFMDSPGQAFPPGAGSMMANGVMCSQAQMSMSSPGMTPSATEPHPAFMGMPPGAMPPSSSAMPPYGMGDTTMGNGGGMMSGMLSAEEMKQSPASTPRGVNGTGTPAGVGAGGPGSAQSGGQAVSTPTVDAMDANMAQQHVSKEEDNEISKIKQGLMDEGKNFGGEMVTNDQFF